MLRDLAVSRIQEGCGFRSDRAETIVSRLQEEQRELERGKTLPGFLKVDTGLALAIGTNYVTLPTDFLRITGDPITFDPENGDDWSSVVWRSYNQISFAPSTDLRYGTPSVAAIVIKSGVIYFDVAADRALTMWLTYYAKDTILDANIENLWLEHAPELLIGGAGVRYARDIRNKEAQLLFSEMYKQARLTWFAEAINEDLQESGDLFMGANN
jgi:hypothetical protein